MTRAVRLVTRVPTRVDFSDYSHQRRAFFSTAEILLRIYQNPIHLNGTLADDVFRRPIHAASKTSSANGSHLNNGIMIYPQQNFRSRKNTRLWCEYQRRAFFSAVEILLRICQNPIHLNGARWRTTFFRRRTSRCIQNLVRQRVPFKCMGF